MNQETGLPSPNTESPCTMILGFQAPSILKNKFLLFVSHPVYGILLLLPEHTQTPSN